MSYHVLHDKQLRNTPAFHRHHWKNKPDWDVEAVFQKRKTNKKWIKLG
jgi:hypothetical protein